MQEDNLKLVIDETLKKFHPLVHPTNYRQVFVHNTYSKVTMGEELEILPL